MRLNKYFHKSYLGNLLTKLPFFHFFYLPKFSRMFVARSFFIITVVIPFIGFFRRGYMKQKFLDQLNSKIQATQLQLKQSLTKLQVHMNNQDDYMIVITGQKNINKTQSSQEDIENIRKIFALSQEIKQNPVAQQLRWVFLGNKDIFEILKDSGIQYHEKQTTKVNQPKVFLIAKDDNDQQKLLMQWSLGVPFSIINKYISKHKYKKYLKSVTF